MKLLLADFLRRWRAAYLVGVLLAVLFEMMWTSYATDARSIFIFAVIFMLPLAADLMRGHARVIATLPLDRRTIAHGYWGLAVGLPVLCVAGTFLVAGVLSACFFSAPPLPILARSFGEALLASLIMAGASCSDMIVFPPTASQENGGFIGSWMLTWLVIIAVALPSLNLLQTAEQSPAVWLAAALLGILLCLWSFRNSERLVITRATPPHVKMRFFRKSPEQIPPFVPSMAGFGGRFFFEAARNSFLMSLLFLGVMLVFSLFKARRSEHAFILDMNEFALPWMLAFCTLGPFGLMPGGVRMLRILPLSASRLALILLLIPLVGILGMSLAVATFGVFYPGQLFAAHPASYLIPMTGAVCLASTFFLPLGAQSSRFIVMPLAMLACLVILATVKDAVWPAAFWWFLGIFLTAAAYFLNRHWLRSSDTYKPATGAFARRQG